MIEIKDSVNDFFKWVKGSKLVELNNIDVSEDPVRPELTLSFRITHGRKIFGLKYNNEIESIACVAICPEIPYTVREMDYMSRIGGKIVIAYTIWSRKKGAGKEIVKKINKWTIENKYERLVTLSPLTPMATHFHISNGAKQVHINDETQNFEYTL
tara:strand:- start:350 stop:817 length:468 start_codon:yes stop_codon:yes gene_type:complete